MNMPTPKQTQEPTPINRTSTLKRQKTNGSPQTKRNLNKSREEKKFTRLHYQAKNTLSEGFEELSNKQIEDMTEEEKVQYKVYLFRQADENDDNLELLKQKITARQAEFRELINKTKGEKLSYETEVAAINARISAVNAVNREKKKK